jgi:hypothetical protein
MQQIVNFYNYHIKVVQDGGKVDWHAVAQAQAARAQELINQQQPKPLPAAVAEASRAPRGKRAVKPKKSAAKQQPGESN